MAYAVITAQGYKKMVKHTGLVGKELNLRRCGAWAVRSVVMFALVMVGSLTAAAPRIPSDDRVITLTIPLETGPFTGNLTSYTPMLFTLTSEAGDRHRVLWSTIPADNLDRYWRFLEEPEGDATRLLELGNILIRHRDGRPLAKRAFDQALALDASLAQAIEQSLRDDVSIASPRYEANADPAMWGELSNAVMQQGIETLRSFAQRTQNELGLDMKVYESQRFMLLTDCNDEQVQALSAKLMEGYRRVAELIDDDPDGNVFVGKCLVVLFDNRVDYIRFQDQLHDTDARGTGGLCHGFSNGHIHIAAFKRNNLKQTNHVVVHELAHAYLRRFRSPQLIDDWINEGLAEYLAHQVEPPPGQNLYLKARLSLEGKKGLGDGFFESENLQAWQYDVAGALTHFLIKRSSRAYPKLIASIKEGTPTDEALQKVYRMTPAKLTLRFKQRLDRELNKKLGG